MKIKKEFILSIEDKNRILEIDKIMVDDGYLNGKALPKKMKLEIDALYKKYISSGLRDGFLSLLDTELQDLKTDPFCKNNSNKRFWVKSYILSWLTELGEDLTMQKCFSLLTCRKAKQILYNNAYEVKQ